VALVIGALAGVFESTILNVALNQLAAALKTDLPTIQWVAAGYMLAMAVVVPVTGWAQNRLGGRRLWLLGIVVFCAGSIGASLAWSAPFLIACRVVQGAATGVMLPVMQNLLVRAAGRAHLGRTMATVGLPIVLGPILGPLIGGAIVTWTTWRWCFWINIPLCFVGFCLAWRRIPRDEPSKGGPSLDVPGLALVAVGVAAVVYGLSQAGSHASFTQIEVALPGTIGLILIGAFTWRTLRRPRDPLVELRLFRIPSFTAACFVLAVSGFAMYSATLLMPLYYQQVRGSTAVLAGLAIAPQGIGNLLTRTRAGRLTDQIGARPVVIVGVLLTTLATVPFVFADAQTPMWWLMIVLVVRGAGLGALTIPTMSASYVDVPRDQVPSASIITRTVQMIGNSFGAAMAAVLLERAMRSMGVTTRTAAGTPDPALAGPFHSTFLWVSIFTVLTLVAASFLNSHPPTKPAETTPQPDH
jgi:EmrB/QacA subfamily drug resistance transporter